MAFVNLSLVLGTLLVAVPIVLHLVMRQKPKQLIFPAVQFIKKRRESNRRTLRLRHWMLLLLRCLAIGMAALALTRPSVSSSLFGNWIVIAALAMLLLLVGVLWTVGLFTNQGKLALVGLGGIGLAVLAALIVMLIGTLGRHDRALIGDREAPVAAVMVLDSSPRMQYRHENQTRLEQAQEIADWMVRQLPADSRVGILDSRAITPVFSIDLAAARKTIQRIRTAGAPRSLEQLLETSMQLVDQSRLKRKEIYVFTDLTAAAWDVDDPDRLRQRIEQAEDVVVYLIDVGAEDPQNIGLGQVQLSNETLPKNGDVVVSTTISCTGKGGKRSVELYVEDVDPTLPLVRDGELVTPAARLRGRRDIELAANGSETIEFRVPELTLGTRHAEIRIVGQDGLPIDNTRFFTVVVRDAWLVLVVAPQGVDTDAFVEAIAPYEYRVENRAPYECTVITPDEMPDHSLQDFAAVAILDPTPLPTPAWRQLGTYVRAGGQLALFLGHYAQSARAFNTAEALELLPGKLGRQYRVSGRDIYLAPHSYDHPIMREFRPIASSVPWDQFPVFRHWHLRDLAPDQNIILRFGNNQPALLQRPVGRGTVLVMTTPITELERPRGRQAWNELAGPDDWPRFILVNTIMQYLTQHEADRLNYEAGQTAELSNRTGWAPSRYLLFTPDGETQPVQARNERLTINATENPGTYRLKGDDGGPVIRGFSVDLPTSASRLERIPPERLDELLGAEQYQLARDRNQIARVQGRQRAGREFFPFLMALLAAILIMEHLLANRFYRNSNPSAL